MSLLISLLFASTALSISLDGLTGKKTFSLEQVAVNRTARHPINVIKEAYWKYAVDFPTDLVDAEQQIKTTNRFVPPGGATTIPAKTINNDLQYLISVK